MKIVLVRHGYSLGNEAGTYTGWSDVSLSDHGVRELESYLNTINYPITDRYYTSDLVRAKQTFDILFGHDKTIYEASPKLREIYFGDYEDIHGDAVPEPFFDGFLQNKRIAKGETFTEFSERIFTKLTSIILDLYRNDLDSATLVCHSGVIKVLRILLEHRPFEDFRAINTPNGKGVVLNIDFNPETYEINLKKLDVIE